MNNDVFKKKHCLMIGCVLVLCMIVGSFYDYQISQALFNKDSVFGVFFASYGQLPAMLCFVIGGTLLLRMRDKAKKVSSILCVIFAILLNVLAILGVTMDPMLYIKGMNAIVSLVIAIVIIVLVDIMIYKWSESTPRETIKKYIILVLSVVFCALIIINLVKIPWGRPRMRMIVETKGASFQPWWVIGSEMKDQLMALGVKAEEFKSFPSGHTGNATCALLLGTLPLLNEKLKGKETMLFVIGFVFALTVAFSRIIMGAHFLSDVTVGMTITFVVECALVHLLFKKERNERQ